MEPRTETRKSRPQKSSPLRPAPIIVSAGGKTPPSANPIESVPRDSVEGAGVVLVAPIDLVADCVMRLKSLGADRIMPVNPDSIDLDGDIDQALRTLKAAGGARAPSASLMRAARACTVKFPKDTFAKLHPCVEKMARLAGAPTEFLAGSLLATASGVSAGRFTIRVRPGFDVPPIAWIALVGDASASKSPAMDAVVKVVRRIEADYRRAYRAELDAAKAEGRKERDVPPPRRSIVTNGSIEAIAHLAAGQWRGLASTYDELSDWFNGLKRYSRSAQGDRGQWLKAHNGYPEDIDRRSMDAPLHVPCWGLSLLGGIPPSVLSALTSAAELESGDGLDVRIWYLFPQLPPVQMRPDASDEGADKQLEAVFRRLFEWRVQACDATVIEFSPEAREKFEQWRFDLLTKARKTSSEVDSWEGKLPGAVARLAGILSILDAAAAGGPPPTIVSIDQLRRAARLADVFSAHRRKVELDRGAPTIERLAAEMGAFIINHKIDKLDTFEARRLVSGVRTEKTLRQVLVELQSAGWLTTYISPRADDVLPPEVVIHPDVFKMAETLQ
jgi:hypothetical protein